MKTTRHGILSSLNKEQKESAGLLQIGTFLEYFDLMLYVHMAVLLNDLFFPKFDPFISSLLPATTFCSIYLLRPFSALLFGYIGDNMGRKPTVIITTIMMASSCIIIANLPTYDEIGITASWIMIACRVIQGMSSMEEVVGAEIYLTESSEIPERYPLVASIHIASALGGTFALLVGILSISYNFNWRYAFYIGASIALVGAVARTALRETPEFINAKRHRDKLIKSLGLSAPEETKSDKLDKKTALSYFAIQCARPACFYFTYVYSCTILKNAFDYSVVDIITHNFLVSLVDTVGLITVVYLSYRIHPLKILKAKLIIFLPIVLLMPFLLNIMSVPFHLFLIQSFFCLFCIDSSPASPVFYQHFPILKRFTYGGLTYAISRAFMYIIVSFGLVFLMDICGNYGLLIILLPVMLAFHFGLKHFTKLEKEIDKDDKEIETTSYIAKTLPYGRLQGNESRLDLHREEIIASLANGESKVSIARRLNTSQVNLYHWLKKRKIRTPKKR